MTNTLRGSSLKKRIMGPTHRPDSFMKVAGFTSSTPGPAASSHLRCLSVLNTAPHPAARRSTTMKPALWRVSS